MGYGSSSELLALACIGLFCVVPFLLGFIILAGNWRSPFARYAGLLTLKPLVATPLWGLAVSANPRNPGEHWLLSLLPGIGLTLLILLVAGKPLTHPSTRRPALVLLALDAARWLSSFALVVLPNLVDAAVSESGLFAMICIPPVLPLVFAVVAFALVSKNRDDLYDEKAKPYTPLALGDLSSPYLSDAPALMRPSFYDAPPLGEKRKRDEIYPPDEKPKRGDGDILIDLPEYKRKNDEIEP